MSILYVNGDSHCDGADLLENEKTFGQLVADYFNLTLVNESKGGCSNSRILRTTKDWIQNNNAVLYLIGWTTWEREEWYFDNQFWQINSSGSDFLPTLLQERYKSWVINNTHRRTLAMGNYWHNTIWDFDQSLVDKNHLFFNLFYPFNKNNNQKTWGATFIGPYENNCSYYHYLKSVGLTPNNHYHYAADGHKAWADFLIKYIEENNLL